MRENPDYAMTDPAEVRALIREHPWATMVSATEAGVVVSHYPFLLEEAPPGSGTDELVLVSHVGRPDERAHRLGESEIAIVFQGPHGYVSPSWYGVAQAVPTWNFAAVHAYGVPEILSDAENLAVLERLVDHFEDAMPDPFRLRITPENAAYAERIVHGTVGFRLRVKRLEAKEKMSQDKPDEVVERITTALEAPGPYRHPALAERIRRARP
ncbi:FMN-binding negative transcriptional regulator [Rathayibacter sp. VKM Ac-2803]|uniref:FMN-binding negative transcriptional regulator n=1 Tax=unclassified Rathayibacter TaxID=2609250 RepID=UPI00135B794D|nr:MULTISPECIES: FMN-binding negative transcriptional regulator [unclassified Rathayibacter]MWV48947.1 FMN-binding negative transcriptional regulator [Rathayibacter sp. VKM Ac-2803]MWV58560.1 FMN-binding negative transcriptional regulator [Rathayibacter sp. VKM Ac-2754]